jgi:two-component system, NarL family, response regulator NreC
VQIGIVLADDHPIFRQGLKSLLEREGFSIAGEGADGFDAIKLAEKFQPDVIVLDLSMPRLNGLSAAKEIQRVSPRTKVILMTVHREEQYVLEAIAAGVKGYVLKSEAATRLADAIRDVYRGNAYFSPAVAQFAVDSALLKCVNGKPAELLSPRELQVLQLIADGNTTREIAAQLKLTVKTTESYRTALMTKLDIHETASLVRYAVRRGLVKP